MLTKTTTVLAFAAGLALMNASAPSASAQLIDSGPNLDIAYASKVMPDFQFPALTLSINPTSFVGEWTAPALSPWHGTFSALGPVPSNVNSGTTEYDFAGLTDGHLPSGTFFRFGDVDRGSATNETFILTAFDANNNPITKPWLTKANFVWGSGNGGNGEPILTDMPGWDWVSSTGTYTFSGSSQSGSNPNVAFSLFSRENIYTMSVDKRSTFNSFHLAAPVIPAPGSMALLGTAGLIAIRRRRRCS